MFVRLFVCWGYLFVCLIVGGIFVCLSVGIFVRLFDCWGYLCLFVSWGCLFQQVPNTADPLSPAVIALGDHRSTTH